MYISVHQRVYVINKGISKMFNPVQRAFERIGVCQQLSFGYVGVVVVQITRLLKSKLALLRGVLLGGSNLEMVSSTDLFAVHCLNVIVIG